MAEAGIGVHMLQIDRVQAALVALPSFAFRWFTEAERAYCDAAVLPCSRYACCLAARGAVYKALGLEPTVGSSRWDVTVVIDDEVAPRAALAGRALEAARLQGVEEVALSLSYSERVAVANALAITAAARPAPKERLFDERAQIARSFREVRSVLDELERVQEDDSDIDAGAALEPGQEVPRETGTLH